MASLTIMAGLVLMLMPSVASADGIAAFPNRLEVDNGLRGGVYERSITLQSDFDEPGVFELESRGPIADWITIQTREGVELTELDAPPKERVSLQVVVTVPDDVPNGIYEGGFGALLLVDGETSGEGTGSGIRLGVVVPITIDITGEQMVSANFLELIVNDGEVGLPHRVIAVVQNTGNVGLAPDVLFEVLAEDEVVDTLEPSLDLVAPGETAQLAFNWETETQRPGAYTARASVSFGELDLGSQDRQFTLAPRGTLTRSGQLTSLELIGDLPRPGGVARVQAQFTNTGQIESRAELIGELFLAGVLIDAPQNPPTLVQPGVVETLELFLDTELPGAYTLIAKVNFEGEETESRTLEFVVEEEVVEPVPEEDGGSTALAVGLGIGGVVLLGGAGFLWWKRRTPDHVASVARVTASAHDGPEPGEAAAENAVDDAEADVPADEADDDAENDKD
jgi:hypothetical protein